MCHAWAVGVGVDVSSPHKVKHTRSLRSIVNKDFDNTSSNIRGQAFALADDISLRSYDSATCMC